MRNLCAILFAVFVVAVGLPASAEIVEVTTSVSMSAPPSDDEMRAVLHAAAKDIIANAAPFQPVVMALTGAYLRAGRLYLRFLVADEAGARILGVVQPNGSARDGDTGAEFAPGGRDLQI